MLKRDAFFLALDNMLCHLPQTNIVSISFTHINDELRNGIIFRLVKLEQIFQFDDYLMDNEKCTLSFFLILLIFPRTVS